MKLETLTLAQKRAICNGIGPRFFGCKCLQLKFYNIGCQHDLDYWVGGPWSNKIKADFRFWYNCLKVSSQSDHKKKLVFASNVYFLLVLFLGWPWFEHGKEKTQADLDKIKALLDAIKSVDKNRTERGNKML